MIYIRNGNTTAICIACQVMTAAPGMPFGTLIKSGFARALKQRVHRLSGMQRHGLIAKTAELLELAYCPRETEDYCQLIQRFGQTELLPRMHAVRATDSKSRILLERLVAKSS